MPPGRELIMPRSSRWFGLILLLSGAVPTARGAPDSGPSDYTGRVKPILKARCYACHGALKRKAGLRLDTGAAIRRGGDGGPAVVSGRADESPLIDRVTSTDPAYRM